MATTEYCYFQDDDWIINHMRAFYANFLRFPHLVHTDTNADVYSLTNWKWCFFDDRKQAREVGMRERESGGAGEGAKGKKGKEGVFVEECG